MSLHDELQGDGVPVTCSVQAALRTLRQRGDDANALKRAIEDDTIPITRIVDVMRRRSIELSESALRRHRKGRCLCGVGRGES